VKKIRVGIIFGGRSGEHEVSLSSAESILKAINKNKYEVVLIGITKKGKWIISENPLKLLKSQVEKEEVVPVALIGEPSDRQIIPISNKKTRVERIDVFFPVLHGPYGEDGSVQGLFELADVPYVGSGVAASAIGLDKDLMKKIFRSEGLPVADYIVFKRKIWEENSKKIISKIEEEIRYPCFIKPANAGSSVGITKVHCPEELSTAINIAAKYDRKILAEVAIDAREIECSLLGNDEPEVSVPGEIIPANEFYDYEAKYHSENSRLIIPARSSEKKIHELQDIAKKAFKAMDCAGMARADFFLEKKTEKVYINELNTIPGFTKISMYPKLWEASGLPYTDLIDKLIQLAIENHKEKSKNITRYI